MPNTVNIWLWCLTPLSTIFSYIMAVRKYIFNSVNEFLNAFGAGRSEVSIVGISTKKLNYSLRTIQPLSELNIV
jgi:hypothetical protein